MRCRGCNCVLAPDDDPVLCAECLSASGAENSAPIASDTDDLVDFIERHDRRTEDLEDGDDEETTSDVDED